MTLRRRIEALQALAKPHGLMELSRSFGTGTRRTSERETDRFSDARAMGPLNLRVAPSATRIGVELLAALRADVREDQVYNSGPQFLLRRGTSMTVPLAEEICGFPESAADEPRLTLALSDDGSRLTLQSRDCRFGWKLGHGVGLRLRLAIIDLTKP